MIAWLKSLLLRWRNRPDPGLHDASVRFGTKPVRSEWQHYDEAKGLAGARRARTQTETGRPIRKRTVKRPAPVVRLDDRRRGRA